MTGRSSGDKVEVPSFVGMDIDEVHRRQHVYGKLHLAGSLRTGRVRPAGGRDTGSGRRRKEPRSSKGTVITLTVSAGGANVSDTYKVIDFAGRSLDYVTTMLDEHEISYTVEEEYSDEVEAGHGHPHRSGAGTEIEPGASLTIYVSKGKETKKVERAQPVRHDRGAGAAGAEPTAACRSARRTVWRTAPQRARSSGSPRARAPRWTRARRSTFRFRPDPASPRPTRSRIPRMRVRSGGQFVSEEPPAPAQGSATVQVTLPGGTDMAHVVVSVDGVVQYDETLDTSHGQRFRAAEQHGGRARGDGLGGRQQFHQHLYVQLTEGRII